MSRVVLLVCAAATALVAPRLSAGAPPDAQATNPTARAQTAGVLHADTILVRGKIITVDAADTIAEALAIRDGKIAAIGKTAAIERLAGPRTEVIDLAGRAVTPGLIDSHCHFASGGIEAMHRIDLSYPGVRSIADAVRRVEESVRGARAGAAGRPAGAAKPPGSEQTARWIQGRGWDEGKLDERRHIRAADLDPVSAGNPVWVVHTMGHYGTANSRALQAAGITRDTPDPPGGTIDRDADGDPTGVLKENAMDLVTRLIPELTAEQIDAAIARISQELSREGMTAVKDPGIDSALWEAYRRVLGRGELTVRVFALWRAGDTLEEARRLVERIAPFTRPTITTGDDMLISGGVKMAIDGSGGARTAWVYEDWNKEYRDVDRGNRGYPLIEPDVFRRMLRVFHDAGLHVGVHSIGDRGIDWTVDSLEEALRATPTRGLRHSVIHCNVPSARALDKLAKLQKSYDAGYPEASATFMWWIGDTYAGNWGPERSLRLNPFRTFLDRGICWGGGSDFSVTPYPARYGIWASMRRQPLLGVYGANPFGSAESVDARAALRSFTSWNAPQLFLEKKIGSLEVGKYADLAVWDVDPYGVEPDAIKEMKCLLTMLGGKIVHRAADGPAIAAPAPAGRP